jgi:hypothetical protein
MSNELAMLSMEVPAHLRQYELDDTTRSLMGGGGMGAKRISIEGSVWRLLVNGKEIAQKEERNLNVIIVAASAHVGRTFYEGVYKKGVTSAPDCWSADGTKPDATAKSPQSNSCATCPQNIKGSGSGEGRACRFSQRIAVVLDNDIGGDVFQLVLPSTSIFGEGEAGKWPLQTYAKMIGAKGVPITSVVTEMRFDTSSSTPKVVFKPVRFLEPDDMTVAINQGKSKAATNAITMTVAQTDSSKTDAPKLEAPKTETVKEEVEPVKVTSKKEAPAPKKDLTEILSTWDDE